jgi:VWFA-related protein
MTHPRRLAAALLLLWAVSDLPPASRAQTQPPPVFRGGTTLVEVDVVVRDGSGRFVADLRPDDFEVLDNGERQEVSAFYRVIGPGDEVAPPISSATQAPATPAPPPQQVQRVLVFYFDPHHIQPGAFDRVRNAAIQFLKKDWRQGDVGGVVANGKMANGRLTSNRDELEAALKAAKPEAAASVTRELGQWPRFVDIVEASRLVRREAGYNPGPTVLDDVTERACRDRPDECRNPAARAAVESQVEAKATQLVANERVASKQVLESISALANGLAKLPGRKTLVLITEGFFVENALSDVQVVVGRAARASVRIYALDSRGLNRGSASSDILSSESPSQPELSAPSTGDLGVDAPNSLAVDTGGYAIRNENDFARAFTEIDHDTSSYYIVGFRPAHAPDGRFHALSVRVKRPGVTARARKGYLASNEPPVAPTLTPAPNALPAGPPGPPVSPIAPVVPPAAAPAAGLPSSAAPAAGVAPPSAGDTAAGAPAIPAAVRATPKSAEDIAKLGGGVVSPTGDSELPAELKKEAAAGWDAYQQGNVTKARDLLRPVAAQAAAPPWTRYVLGWSHFALGEAAPAAENWEKVRAAVPQFEPVYFDLADAYQRQGEFANAIAVLRDAEARWPKDADVYSALGVVQLARGAVDDAVGTFTKGAAVNPSDANVCYNLAKTYEVRYVRGERLRKIGPGSGAGATSSDDRAQAVALYQRVIALGGPLVEQAKEGLKRLGQ